jgi:hypothetical protein
MWKKFLSIKDGDKTKQFQPRFPQLFRFFALLDHKYAFLLPHMEYEGSIGFVTEKIKKNY